MQMVAEMGPGGMEGGIGAHEEDSLFTSQERGGVRRRGKGSDGPEVFVEAKALPSDWEQKGRVEAMSGELDHPGTRLRKGIQGDRLQAH